MKLLPLFLLLTGPLFSQFLPTKDSVYYKLDGSNIKYKVESNAVYIENFNKVGLSHGTYTAYYKNGKLWRSENRVNGRVDGFSYSFTSTGDTVKIEFWTFGKLNSRKVFYSSHSSASQKYYLVSKTGFETVKDGLPIEIKENGPDSLTENRGDCVYMWLQGKLKLIYGECTRFEYIKSGETPGFYSVRDEEKTFIRPLTVDEMKQD